MTRVKRGVQSHARHKKVLDKAKGYYGRRSKCFRNAKHSVEKALQYAYRDRRCRRRDLRALWIQRINAAVRGHGWIYSTFIHALNGSGITLNRKVLSEMAIHNPDNFSDLLQNLRPDAPVNSSATA